MDHRQIANRLQQSRFHTYPSGGTAKSQAAAMIRDLQVVLDRVRDHEDVPPWVIMKISEAADAVSSVSRYIDYETRNGGQR